MIGLICLLFAILWSWIGPTGEGYKEIISSDGKGYYQYLPSLFIDHNLDSQTPDYRFINETIDGKGYNKYFVGTSLLMAPFFGLANVIALFTDDIATGYSPVYHIMISLAGLSYLLLGLIFMLKLFRLIGFNEWIIVTCLIAAVFGTNLFSYGVLMPSMSHIYSFFAISGFLYFYKAFFIHQKVSYHYWGLLFLVLVVLIRPINGIILFSLPILADSWKSIFLTFKKHILNPKAILFSFCIASLLLIQPIIWYIQTGSFILWNYKGEGFYFLSPFLSDFLFSFRKGWLIYTPIVSIAIAGLYFWFKKDKQKPFYYLVLLLIIVYVMSSWWCWYYGPSFSQRPMVEFYSFIFIPFAFILASKLRYIIIGLSIAFISLNLIQNYQYQYNIISSWDMDWEKYKYTFLKTSEEYKNSIGGCHDIIPYKVKRKIVVESFHDFEEQKKYWTTQDITPLGDSNNVLNFYYRKPATQFEYDFELNEKSERGLFLTLSLDKMQISDADSKISNIVIDIEDDTHYHSSFSFKVDELPTAKKNQWQKLHYEVELYGFRAKKGKIRLYFWDTEKSAFYLDNLDLTLFNLKY